MGVYLDLRKVVYGLGALASLATVLSFFGIDRLVPSAALPTADQKVKVEVTLNSATTVTPSDGDKAIVSRSSADIEFEYWTSIKSSVRVRDFEDFLKKYPNGNFAGPARARIAALNVPAETTPSLPIAGSAVLAGDGSARPVIDPELLPDEPPTYELPHGQVSSDISQNPAPRPVIVP